MSIQVLDLGAQNIDLVLKGVFLKVNTIESGKYSFNTYWKPFSYDLPKIQNLTVAFRLLNNGNKINCTIKDSIANSTTIFDGTSFKKVFSHKDSILSNRLSDNPYQYLFEPIEPYFLEKYFSFKRNMKMRDSGDVYVIEDYTDFDTLDEFINPLTTFKIRKSDSQTEEDEKIRLLPIQHLILPNQSPASLRQKFLGV